MTPKGKMNVNATVKYLDAAKKSFMVSLGACTTIVFDECITKHVERNLLKFDAISCWFECQSNVDVGWKTVVRSGAAALILMDCSPLLMYSWLQLTWSIIGQARVAIMPESRRFRRSPWLDCWSWALSILGFLVEQRWLQSKGRKRFERFHQRLKLLSPELRLWFESFPQTHGTAPLVDWIVWQWLIPLAHTEVPPLHMLGALCGLVAGDDWYLGCTLMKHDMTTTQSPEKLPGGFQRWWRHISDIRLRIWTAGRRKVAMLQGAVQTENLGKMYWLHLWKGDSFHVQCMEILGSTTWNCWNTNSTHKSSKDKKTRRKRPLQGRRREPPVKRRKTVNAHGGTVTGLRFALNSETARQESLIVQQMRKKFVVHQMASLPEEAIRLEQMRT